MPPVFIAIMPWLVLAATPALAHHVMDNQLPQTFMQGLFSGLGHPLIGLDHAAFIICAGFFLGLVKRGEWGIAALIAGSLFGALMHLAEISLPGGEILVALSVIFIAGLLLARRSISFAWVSIGLALAGVFHGSAYAESIFGAETTPLGAYLLGFSLIQFCVAFAALHLHRRSIVAREGRPNPLSKAIGVITGMTGLLYLVINAAGA
ncbi:MAG: HupE/UreJ family protein [Burkholderiales bacterium]